MSAAIVWTCDICHRVATKDVTAEAAWDGQSRVGYPAGWRAGADVETDACEREYCQTEARRREPDSEPHDTGDTL